MNIILRLIAFLARKIISIAIVILLIVLATFISYDMANIYVIINDGLSERAETIIHRENPADLERFFTLKYLNSDPMFHSEQFKDYIVQDYEFELKIKKMWVWPWESSTEVVVEEFIPESSWKFSITDEMRERLIAEQYPPEQEGGEENEDENENTANQNGNKDIKLDIPAPQWQNGEKIVEFRKIEGKWKINNIEFVKSIDPEQRAEKSSKD
ncbi:MAG TPA: hypothetical protein GX505_04640 [Clostridiales bacterium]|nr:hypothetical protein [Clostridiales bacterium]